MASNIPCEGKYCGKGLKVEVARFFPVAQDSEAQPIEASLTADFPTLGESYRYSLSTLRSGYFYVFNDARGSWDGYFVTESASQPRLLRFLANLSDRQVVVQNILDTHRYTQYDANFFVNCECNKDNNDANEQSNANSLGSVIANHESVSAVARATTTNQRRNQHQERVNINTISLEGDPSQFTSLYFIFSDTEWTSENFKNVIGARGSYMQRVNLQNIVDKTANEIHNSLLVRDMMGIATELSNLVQLEQSTLSRNIETNYNYWLCDTIDGLEAAIKRRTETKFYDDAIGEYDEAFERLYPDPEARTNARNILRIALIQGGNNNTVPDIFGSRTDLDRRMLAAWQKYENLVNRSKYQSVRQETSAAVEACNRRVAVLDEAIAAILQHSHTSDYFLHSFDRLNREHGIALAGVLGNAINNTGDLKRCSELYQTWLTQEDMNNPLWRALCCDEPTLITEVRRADTYSGTASFLASSFNWKNAFGIYGKYIGGNVVQQRMIQNYVARLSTGVGGPLTRLLLNNNTPRAVTRTLFILGIHAEAAVHVTDITGMTPGQATRVIINNHLDLGDHAKPAGANARNNPSRGILSASNRALLTEELMARYTARGLVLPENGKITGMAITQKSAILTSSRGVISGTHIVTNSQIKALAVHTPAGAILGMLSLIAYGVFFASSWNTVKANSNLDAKDWAGFGAICLSTLGAFAGVAGKTLDAVAAARHLAPTAAKGLTPAFLTSQTSIRILSIGGQLLGGVGGVVIGVLEYCNAYKEVNAGNLLLSTLHASVGSISITVGVIGIRQAYVVYRGGSAALVRGAGIVWWLIIAMIVISLVIAWIKSERTLDPLQQWLTNHGFDKSTIETAEAALEVIFNQVNENADENDELTWEQVRANYIKEFGDID